MPAAYDPYRDIRRQEAERERARKAAERARKAAEAERKAAHQDARKDEAARINSDLAQHVEQLNSFLVAGLPATAEPNLSELRVFASAPLVELGDLGRALPEPRWEDFAPPPPSFWRRNFSKTAIADEEQRARIKFTAARLDHAVRESARQRELDRKIRQEEAEFVRSKEAADRVNADLDDLMQRFNTREKSAVEKSYSLILSLIPRPAGFPNDAEVTFDPRNENLVVELELPPPSCVPDTKRVKYMPTRDEISRTARPPRELSQLYGKVIAQFCLLAIRALLNADDRLRQVSLNGRVRHVNRQTGHEGRPHIISVLVDRENFSTLVLDRAQPDECLKYLRALVSPHPFELVPVEPLVDFDKSRLAFVEGLDMISHLDGRPDLMTLSPNEFEHLIRELFDADPTIESVESLVTRASNDGGIDGVIYVKQPLGRSMTAVQVKQYARSRALGPAHVRELIGAMHESKAGNGLLVTTSSFTRIATLNAQEFGRIQLIDGNNLVHLFKLHLKKDVLIGDRPHTK
jgi:restriction system protein